MLSAANGYYDEAIMLSVANYAAMVMATSDVETMLLLLKLYWWQLQDSYEAQNIMI